MSKPKKKPSVYSYETHQGNCSDGNLQNRSTAQDKQEVDQLIKKINEKLSEGNNVKKAVRLIEELLKSKKK